MHSPHVAAAMSGPMLPFGSRFCVSRRKAVIRRSAPEAIATTPAAEAVEAVHQVDGVGDPDHPDGRHERQDRGRQDEVARRRGTLKCSIVTPVKYKIMAASNLAGDLGRGGHLPHVVDEAHKNIAPAAASTPIAWFGSRNSRWKLGPGSSRATPKAMAKAEEHRQLAHPRCRRRHQCAPDRPSATMSFRHMAIAGRRTSTGTWQWRLPRRRRGSLICVRAGLPRLQDMGRTSFGGRVPLRAPT